MSTDQNKAVLRRWNECWNTRSVSALEALADEIFTADFIIHDKTQPAQAVGREGVKQFVRDALKNTPDFHLSIEDIVAEGDRVAGRYIVSGTSASTGKMEHTLVMGFYRFANGLVAEAWGIDIQVEPQA